MERINRSKSLQYLRGYGMGVENPDERGRQNEKRAYGLMQELTEEGLLKTVKRASRKQDKKGVDFWVYPTSRTEGLRIPFQVKSSAKQAEQFRSRFAPHEIATVVVNNTKSDIEVKEEIIRNMATWISRNVRKAEVAEVVNAPV